MADNTAIEWTDATWNPITGCSVVSPGCTNCYAMKLAGTRLKNVASRKGLTRDTKAGPVWTGEVRFNETELLKPLSWKRPRKIFVCAHGDLMHEDVPDEWIDRVFAVMALTPQHTYQVLTKRSARMRAYLTAPDRFGGYILDQVGGLSASTWGDGNVFGLNLPLPNVWLGVSAEDQARADERIPDLLATPAAVRWVSAEPLLGPIDWKRWLPAGRIAIKAGTGEQFIAPHFYMTKCEHCGWVGSSELCGTDNFGDDSDVYCPSCHRSICGDDCNTLDWVVVGGESGDGARPMHPDWARSLRDQCAAADVAFLFKQWGNWKPISHMSEAEHDALYTPPSTAKPKRRRRRKVGVTVLHNDGDRFDRDRVAEAGAFAAGKGAMTMFEVGKKAAGRVLDGQLHDAFPEAR